MVHNHRGLRCMALACVLLAVHGAPFAGEPVDQSCCSTSFNTMQSATITLVQPSIGIYTVLCASFSLLPLRWHCLSHTSSTACMLASGQQQHQDCVCNEFSICTSHNVQPEAKLLQVSLHLFFSADSFWATTNRCNCCCCRL